LAREHRPHATVPTRRNIIKKLFVFDLDGTLAPSKSPLGSDVAALLHDLLGVMKVAVISGGDWSQFQKQLLANLPDDERLKDLSLLPTCGTQFYEYVGHWSNVYSEDLSDDQRARIKKALQDAYDQSGTKVDKTWGEVIEDRGSQITMSVLGQEAPLAEKEKWDPDFAKRTKIIAILQPMLPEFAIHMGGTTSIDITKPGIDKAYGIEKLHEQLGIDVAEMLFAGDAIFPGGNDYPAQEAGVDSILVRDPWETARVIQTVIACLGDGKEQIKSPGKHS
jgi:phosphomannomutase